MTKIPTTTNEAGKEVMILSRYRHCGTQWTDLWDCACDDECPVCGNEIQSYEYEEVLVQP
jgi:hypothetical protein